MESFVNWITTVNNAVNGVVWGVPALALLIGTGILMTILTKGFQFTRYFDFFVQVHAAAGRLLAVTQCCIKNLNLSSHDTIPPFCISG